VIYKDKIVKELVEVPGEPKIVEKVVYKDRIVKEIKDKIVEVPVEKIVFQDKLIVVAGAGASPSLIQRYISEIEGLNEVIATLTAKSQDSTSKKTMKKVTNLKQVIEQM
jgi:hypothetical protein